MIKQLVAEPPRVTFLNPLDAVVEHRCRELAFVELADRSLNRQQLQIITRASSPHEFIASFFVEQPKASLIEQGHVQ